MKKRFARMFLLTESADNMNSNTINVCFVCTGNACRSPFAECVLTSMLARVDSLDANVFSCGTLDWGKNPRDGEMVRIAAEMGYSMTGETIHMSRELLSSADVIVVFEHAHRDEVTKVLEFANWNRIVLFNMLAFGQYSEVEDPNFMSEAVYRRVAAHIEEGCRNITEKWTISPPLPKDSKCGAVPI